uniref:Uncharacterized protein n=1 Tax=Rhipicephalus appendiculatus TaxID=34631 RepID=A0A131YDY9_RHIAP
MSSFSTQGSPAKGGHIVAFLCQLCFTSAVVGGTKMQERVDSLAAPLHTRAVQTALNAAKVQSPVWQHSYFPLAHQNILALNGAVWDAFECSCSPTNVHC